MLCDVEDSRVLSARARARARARRRSGPGPLVASGAGPLPSPLLRRDARGARGGAHVCARVFVCATLCVPCYISSLKVCVMLSHERIKYHTRSGDLRQTWWFISGDIVGAGVYYGICRNLKVIFSRTWNFAKIQRTHKSQLMRGANAAFCIGSRVESALVFTMGFAGI